ncbi:39S ribosomal protein L40, mitochondrial [Amphibalanus amphitrite]|uniref:Large ribosomal subunit protein mL40 n=1 Tax=Amphibalanus amphitrite TaxID=1232801 RepID=A0A6A4WDV4_AMPAM|nr:39S ribosomal protein L40, mitochondrial [Amphibalanus amphitrite]KAF0304866.1 39S ribosomal protein L40, mitochondrial [Amphibalanus amphitrite]
MALSLGLSTVQRLAANVLDMSLSRSLCALTISTRRVISTSSPAAIAVSHPLCAEPLKKKKRIDPAVVRAREERRRRKLEKAIRRLEKSSRQLKPLAEMELPREVRAELSERRRPARPLTTEEANERFDLMKEWTRHRREQHVADVAVLRRIQESRAKALRELRAESFQLYCAAIEEDPDLVPWAHSGPTLTPPIDGYDAPDGDYVDTTRRWE